MPPEGPRPEELAAETGPTLSDPEKLRPTSPTKDETAPDKVATEVPEASPVFQPIIKRGKSVNAPAAESVDDPTAVPPHPRIPADTAGQAINAGAGQEAVVDKPNEPAAEPKKRIELPEELNRHPRPNLRVVPDRTPPPPGPVPTRADVTPDVPVPQPIKPMPAADENTEPPKEKFYYPADPNPMPTAVGDQDQGVTITDAQPARDLVAAEAPEEEAPEPATPADAAEGSSPAE